MRRSFVCNPFFLKTYLIDNKQPLFNGAVKLIKMEDIEDIIEGVLERPVEDSDSKGWLKKSFSKKWRKGFYVLRKYCSSDQAFIQWFDKEENWRNQIARGTLELFPQYRVLKRNEMKGKTYVFEVSNDADTYVLTAESETVMDLWVMQLQMQTRLNPRVAGKTFRIKGSASKAMQRIGAKEQSCLLHISKWGVTLALERTRAVLAQWPLTTIRNYESMDRGEFSFEAGRKSPMGEGKYTFYTHAGEDNRIFDTIDKFASERLRTLAGGGGGSALVANSEEEMSRAYDQLRFSVLHIPAGPPDEDFSMASSTPRSINPQQDMDSYSHIGRSDSIGSSRLSIGSYSTSMEQNFTDGYNSVGRHSSFGSRSEGPPVGSSAYDCLDHARSQISLSVKEVRGGLNRSPSGYSHISTASFRGTGTPDFYKKDLRLRPLEVSPESDPGFSDELVSPVSSSSAVLSDSTEDPLSMSGDFSTSPLQGVAVSSSTLTEDDPLPPPLPERSKKMLARVVGPPVEMLPPVEPLLPRKERRLPPPPPPDEESFPTNTATVKSRVSRVQTLPAYGSKAYEKFEHLLIKNENGVVQNGQSLYSKTKASPNFIYLNSTHSNSVEVLCTLYATVDKSKKKKNREAAERKRKEYEALKQRRKSRSHESLAGSPRLNSFSFTPFTFKGLAAMDSSSEEDFKDVGLEIETSLVSPKPFKSERVSMALRGSTLNKNDTNNKAELGTINDGKPSSVPSAKDMDALQRAIGHSPRGFLSKMKRGDKESNDSNA